MRGLPDGWKWKEIQEISDRNHPYPVGDGDHGQIKPSMYLKEGIPYIRVNDIRKNTIRTDELVYISTQTHAANPKSHLLPDDIIIAKTGATIGRTAIIPKEMKQANTTSSVGKITVDRNKVIPKYLLYYINSPEFQQEMWKVSHKSAQPGFNIADLKKFLIPIAPMPTQERITQILERAEKSVELREQANQMANRILQALFLQMFGDPISNPRKWKLMKLNQVGTIARGKSKHRPRNAPELLGGEYPFIQTGDIANCMGYIRNYSQTYSELGLKQSKMWVKGTLCITIAANIAATGILTFDACFPDSVVGFTPNKSVRTEYVQYWLSFLQKTLEANAPKSAQRNINLKILSELDVPVPPIELQNKFQAVVERVRELEEGQKLSAEETENLFNSLMSRAFKGELLQ